MTAATFTKFHIAIDRSGYERQRSANPDYGAKNAAVEIVPATPEYDTVMALLHRVGGPWQWHRRPKYAPAARANIETRLKHPETRLRIFRVGGTPVGYALMTPVDMKDAGTRTAFKNAANANRVIEVENFGFFPEYTGHGFGRHALPVLFRELFAEYDRVYLSTRSTNHARVVAFYESLGMHVIGREEMPDDLITPESSPALRCG